MPPPAWVVRSAQAESLLAAGYSLCPRAELRCGGNKKAARGISYCEERIMRANKTVMTVVLAIAAGAWVTGCGGAGNQSEQKSKKGEAHEHEHIQQGQ